MKQKGKSENFFAGYCGFCKKWGHKVATCYSNPDSGKSGKPQGAGTNNLDTEEAVHALLGHDLYEWDEDDDWDDWDADEWPTWSCEDVTGDEPAAEDETPMEVSWMMALLHAQSIDAIGYNMPGPGVKGYGLIDSGSAVTAAPWAFGEDQDTAWPDQPLQLTSVQGASLDYYGKRVVPCTLTTSEGEPQPAKLHVEVADVSKVVISVGKLADQGTGTWMPPDGGGTYYLTDPNGKIVPLNGPCLSPRHI